MWKCYVLLWAWNESEEFRRKMLKRKHKCNTGGSIKFPIVSQCRRAGSAITHKLSVSLFSPLVFQLPCKYKALRKQLGANVLYRCGQRISVWSLKSCCACNQLVVGKGEGYPGVFLGGDCIQGPGFAWCPVSFPSPTVSSSLFVLRRLCRKCLHHMEALVMISPYGKYQLGYFPVKTTLSPPHVS